MAAAVSSTLNPPTVTEADLHAFHESLFGAPFAGWASPGDALQQYDGDFTANATSHGLTNDITSGHTRTNEGGEQENEGAGLAEEGYYEDEEYYEYYEEEEDDLGYYPDGVKRTLTDDQIAIFRHSEIQALLRERRLAREAEEYEGEEFSREGGADVDPGNIVAVSSGEEGELADEPVEVKDDDKRPRSTSSEEQEYAAFLRAERREFQRAAAARRNGERHTYDPDDRTISTRRRVREMDGTQPQNEDALMYDDAATTDEPAGSTAASTRGRKGETAGRRFWWPEIRPGG